MGNTRPKIWVWVIVRKENKILLWKRKNAHWEWYRWFPWWHLEFNERVEDCSIREVLEETGLTVDNIQSWSWFTNDMFEEEDKHYITLYTLCDHTQWEVKVMEPNKCEQWEWFERENMPDSLFLPIQNLKKQNFHPFKL